MLEQSGGAKKVKKKVEALREWGCVVSLLDLLVSFVSSDVTDQLNPLRNRQVVGFCPF